METGRCPDRVESERSAGSAAMLEVDALDALDLSVWYQGSVAAAEVAGCSPSTTSRRLHQALACFHLRLHLPPWSRARLEAAPPPDSTASSSTAARSSCTG